MKNSLESIAIGVVALLSLLIISFIIWYNLVDDSIVYHTPTTVTPSKETKKVKTEAYLNKMENYEDDTEGDKKSGDSTQELNIVNTRNTRANSKQSQFINDVSSALNDAIEN